MILIIHGCYIVNQVSTACKIDQGSGVWFLEGAGGFSVLQNCPEWLWSPYRLLFNGYWRLFLWGKITRVWSWMLTSIKCACVELYIHVFMLCTGLTTSLLLYSFIQFYLYYNTVPNYCALFVTMFIFIPEELTWLTFILYIQL